MDLGRLRDRCRRLLEQLSIPSPFDTPAFCHQIAGRRGRPIHLHPMTNATAPCGMWVATGSADHIFYESSTSPLHRDHIILHEISHMLCDHQPAPVLDDELVRLLLPDLDPGMVHRVLARTAYSVEEEHEAELLASLIRERADRDDPPRETATANVPTAVRRVESVLE